jgi:5-bromo-4-chloroindolyl phosphate hydrolysis protein
MIHKGSGRIIFTFIIKPLFFVLLLIGVFGLVYLRSSVMTLEYKLGELEKTKMDYLRERKMLLAEKTSMVSFKKIASLDETQGFVFPDRIRVIHVKKQGGSLPYKATLERKQLTEP